MARPGRCVNEALVRHLENMSQDPATEPSMLGSLSKAVQSLAAHNKVIRTVADVRNVPFIGPWTARQIAKFLDRNPQLVAHVPGQEGLIDQELHALAMSGGVRLGELRSNMLDDDESSEHADRISNVERGGDDAFHEESGQRLLTDCSAQQLNRTSTPSVGRGGVRYRGSGQLRGQARGRGRGRGRIDSRENEPTPDPPPSLEPTEQVENSVPKRPRAYSPKVGSAGFAVMLALGREGRDVPQGEVARLTKAELVAKATPYANEPIVARQQGGTQNAQYYYDGWSTVNKTLIEKHQLLETDNKRPKRFWLSQKGMDMVDALETRYTKMRKKQVVHFSPPPHDPGCNSRLDAARETNPETGLDPMELALLPYGTVSQRSRKELETHHSNDRFASRDRHPTHPPSPAPSGLQTSRGDENREPHSDVPTPMADPPRNSRFPDNDVSRALAVARRYNQDEVAIFNFALDFLYRGLDAAKTTHSRMEANECRQCHCEINPTRETPQESCEFPHVGGTKKRLQATRPDIADKRFGADVGVKQPTLVPNPIRITPSDLPREACTVTMKNDRNPRYVAPKPLAVSLQNARPLDCRAARVILFVDNREIYGAGRESMASKLGALPVTDIRVEIKVLDVGDALFVARPLGAADDSQDVVLDFLIERKTSSDLATSLRDGRYRRQKHFMKQTGIRNLIYLFEGRTDQQNRVSEAALNSSLNKTAAADGFIVHRVKSMDETVAFFQTMHKRLDERFGFLPWNTTQMGRPNFKVWAAEQLQKRKSKNLGDLFTLQLMSIPRVGEARAKTIIQLCGVTTAAQLRNMYDRCASEEEKESLLFRGCAEGGSRRVDLDTSKLVYRLFNWLDYDDE